PYPSLYPAVKIDTSGFLWRFKKKSFNDVHPLIITPSKWLNDKVEKSILSHCRAKIINNAVDDSIFYPLPKAEARKQLGLSKDDFIILFAVQGGSVNSWKGFTYAVEALQQLQNTNKKVTLICLGNKKKSESLVQENVKIRNVGYIDSESSMRAYYSAAEAYLLPSVADNSPLGIIESLACGTPVISFNVGGIPELVDHQKTGYIAEYKNTKDLSNGIEWLMSLSSDMMVEMSKECAQKTMKKHALRMQMKDYLDVYRQAICEMKN
ncbi:MAG: glycosyltransferase, partial [Planctomycetota bacterium]